MSNITIATICLAVFSVCSMLGGIALVVTEVLERKRGEEMVQNDFVEHQLRMMLERTEDKMDRRALQGALANVMLVEAIKEICDLGIEEIERDRDKYQHPFEIQRGYITILGMIGRRLDGKKKPEDLDDDWG